MRAVTGTELHWDHVGVEDKLKSLLAVVKSGEANTSRLNARLFGKLERWRQQLETVIAAGPADSHHLGAKDLIHSRTAL